MKIYPQTIIVSVVMMGIASIALGYPAAELAPAKPRKENYYRIIR